MQQAESLTVGDHISSDVEHGHEVKEPTNERRLQRKLKARQLSMIAMGGSIGTGLFLASGSSIYFAGPGGALLAYILMGVMVYFLMTSLGEMSAAIPISGSFYSYGSRFVDPAFGFALGWNYWYNWAITVAAEIAAASMVMRFWFPHSSPLLWSVMFLSLFVGLNVISVKGFGEAEYWFSMIKVLVIVAFIIIGSSMVFGITGDYGAGWHYWTMGDAPFHGGWLTTLGAFVVVGFSFQGTELIGVAAGESQQPDRQIPKAMQQVFWRILLFYVLAILVISLLIPYTSEQLVSQDVALSPFTLVFQQSGLRFAAGLMNAVILVAILSAGNSGMYASTRMLWHLANQGHVPRIFSRVTRQGVPVYALLATAMVGMATFLTSLFGNGVVYFWLLSASSLSGFLAWFGIAVSHYRFRRAYKKQGYSLSQLPYIAKGYPYAPLLAAVMCVLVIVGQNLDKWLHGNLNWYQVAVTYAGVLAFLGLWLGYKLLKKTRVVALEHSDLSDLQLANDGETNNYS